MRSRTPKKNGVRLLQVTSVGLQTHLSQILKSTKTTIGRTGVKLLALSIALGVAVIYFVVAHS